MSELALNIVQKTVTPLVEKMQSDKVAPVAQQKAVRRNRERSATPQTAQESRDREYRIPKLSSRTTHDISDSEYAEYEDLSQYYVDEGVDEEDARALEKEYNESMSDIQAFCNRDELVGPPLKIAGVAEAINGNLRKMPLQTKIKGALEGLLRPENLPNVVPPETNKIIDEHMRFGAKTLDSNLFKAQSMIGKVITPVAKMVDIMNSSDKDIKDTTIRLKKSKKNSPVISRPNP